MFDDADNYDGDDDIAGMFGDAMGSGSDGGCFDDADDDTSDAAFASLLAKAAPGENGVNAIDNSLSSLLLENQGGGYPAALPLPVKKNTASNTKATLGGDIVDQLFDDNGSGKWKISTRIFFPCWVIPTVSIRRVKSG